MAFPVERWSWLKRRIDPPRMSNYDIRVTVTLGDRSPALEKLISLLVDHHATILTFVTDNNSGTPPVPNYVVMTPRTVDEVHSNYVLDALQDAGFRCSECKNDD
jgi:hypothetical protein